MLFKSLVQASLVASVLSRPLHQHHEHDKRDVKLVTKTNLVVVTVGNGQPTTFQHVDLPKPSSSVSVNTDTTYTPQNKPTAVSSVASVSTSEAETETESSASSESTESSSGGSSASGNGITYSPYSNDGGCKSSSQIKLEIEQLAEFDILRLYGVDCGQVNAVMSAKKPSQKVFAGIFDVANIQDSVDTLSKAVEANGGWDHIHTVSVGNELVNSGEATVGQVKGYVSTAKSALKSAGYSGPVVAVDTFIAVINNPGLCDIGDYTAVNAHAFFDGYVTAEDAGDWVLLQIERVATACSNKKSVYITETGWPSKGESNGVAVPSKSNQKSAISSIKKSCGNDAILFTAFNDYWKADGSFGAEKFYGILSN